MWSLKADGSFVQNDTTSQDNARVIVFENGCGFSEATQVRRAEPAAHIVAKGELIPDQARMAFQSGIDEILLDDVQLARYGTDSWQQALSSSVTSLYAARGVSRLEEQTSIWRC